MRFKRTDIFGEGFMAHRKHAQGHVMNLILNGHIDEKGFVSGGTLTELWSYVYLLVIHNKTHDILKNFIAQRGILKSKSMAKRFYSYLQKYSSSKDITPTILMDFINYILTTNVKNPVMLMTGTKEGPKIISKECEDLFIFRKLIQKELNTTSDDVQVILDIIRKHAEQNNEIKTNEKNAFDCAAEMRALNKSFLVLSKFIIISKMCMVKFIGQVTNQPEQNTITCKRAFTDISRQRKTYEMLNDNFKKKIDRVYKSNLTHLSKYKKDIDDIERNISCENVVEKREKIKILKHDLHRDTVELMNVYEDLHGAVRMYVRVRNYIPGLDGDISKLQWKIEKKHITLECNEKTFNGSFYDVFDNSLNNAGIYKKSLVNTFQQLESGYSIVFSGYGESGSGKTFNFMGNKNDPGIIIHGLSNLKNNVNIEIVTVFELYYDYISFINKILRGKIVLSYESQPSIFVKSIARYGITLDDIEYDPVDLPHKKISDTVSIQKYLTENIAAIQLHQQIGGRIKKTPNNDKSSRSHLFVVFKVGDGYLTMIDMAGMENCNSIYHQIFSKKYSLDFLMMQFDSTGKYKGAEGKERIGDFINYPGIKPKSSSAIMKKNDDNRFESAGKNIEDTVKANVQILFESVFITESLNHLKYFYAKKNGNLKLFKNMKSSQGNVQYNTEHVFIQPSFEDGNRDQFSLESKKVTNPKGQILIIPIMKYLEGLSTEGITKFITIVSLRPDRCENIEILKFAQECSLF